MAEATPKSVRRIDPLDELDLFESWRPFGGRLGRLLEEALGERGHKGRVLPALDIAEDDDQYVITAELPGTKKEDVTVELHDNVMTIRGEKRNERESKKEHCRWVERSYGSFSRSFSLPANADENRVKASFENGVLTVEVGKAEEAKPRVISIKS